ncbi:MAG TPA: MurR/RpiR family transcriptional regulator [Ktedonobacteraceae bacterium]|nr:MurR/RpiR family transcriptional regulator [Ktedonobacteraceae bacterium]
MKKEDPNEGTHHGEREINQSRSVEPAPQESEELGQPVREPLHHLRQNLSTFSPAERQIGVYVLEHPREVLRLPTDQLAREIGVSQGTLSNFSQALGYSGFKAFRLALAAEVNTPFHLDQTIIARGDTLQTIANKAISANVDALLTTLRSLEMSEIEKTIEAVQQARRVDLYANGISSSVALDAFNRFLTMGLSVSWLPDIANQLASASLLTVQDVALAFSYAGETRATVKAMSLAHQQGATTIAVTSNPHSSLARYADIKLVVTPREPITFHQNLRISARIAMLALVDIIALGLFNSLDDASLAKMASILHLYGRGNEPQTTPAREAGQSSLVDKQEER